MAAGLAAVPVFAAGGVAVVVAVFLATAAVEVGFFAVVVADAVVLAAGTALCGLTGAAAGF